MSLDPNIQAFHDVYVNYSDYVQALDSEKPPPPKLFLKVDGKDRIVTTKDKTKASSVDEIIKFSKQLLSKASDMPLDDLKEVGQSLMYLGYRVQLEGSVPYRTSIIKKEEIEEAVGKTDVIPPDAIKLMEFVESDEFADALAKGRKSLSEGE